MQWYWYYDDKDRQDNRQQPGNGPRYQQQGAPYQQQGTPNRQQGPNPQQRPGQQPGGPYWQQGTPYQANGYRQNFYRPNAWRPNQNPASFGSSLRREFSKDGHFSFPWWAILMGFVFWFPLGFIFLVLNWAFRQNANQARRNQAAGQYRAQSQYQTPPRPQTQQKQQAQGNPVYSDPASQPKVQPVQYSTAEKSKADILFIVGIVLAVIGGLGGVAELFDTYWILTDAHDLAWFLEEMWPLAMFFFGGLGMCYGAQRMRTSWMKRRKIANIVGDADHMYVEDIASSLGCSEEECRQHLENCILKGMFGPAAYIDMHSRALVVRGVPPEPREKPKPQEKPAAQETKEEKPPEGNEKYEKILKELRRVNDAIPDEEMSDKISRLEAVSSKIFAQIQENPEKLPQMRKFMDYYLPTSLKLLDTYAELEAQGIEGTNIRESKRRIEQSMDTLVVAFENQLDKLFQDDALDVSADIDVMEQMLTADGLTGDDPFGLGAGVPKAPQPPKL